MRLHTITVGYWSVACSCWLRKPGRETSRQLIVNGSFRAGPEDIGDFLSLDKDSGAIKGGW